jgi:hypothetical protein
MNPLVLKDYTGDQISVERWGDDEDVSLEAASRIDTDLESTVLVSLSPDQVRKLVKRLNKLCPKPAF